MQAPPARILVLGMGGGVLPAFFRAHYPHATIDVVEMDSTVIKVAQEYFNFRADDRTVAHHSEGRRFLDSNRDRFRDHFDLILQDACPQPLCGITTVEGMQILHSWLRDGGVFVHNTWKYQPRCVRTLQEVLLLLLLLLCLCSTACSFAVAGVHERVSGGDARIEPRADRHQEHRPPVARAVCTRGKDTVPV